MQLLDTIKIKPTSNTLKKKLGIFDLFSIGFGAIVGVGWVISLGEWINAGGGPIPAALAFLAAAFILIPVAKAYGELTASMPVAGGAIVYVSMSFGRVLSYYTGWFLSLAYIMLCPWEVIAIGQLLEVLFPILKSLPMYTIREHVVYAPSLILSLLVGMGIIFINLKGVEYVVKLQKLLVTGMLLVVSLTGICSILFGSTDNLLPILAKTTMNTKGSFIYGFLSVLSLTPFFFSGFDTIPQEAEECHGGINKQKLGWVISASICVASVFYVLVIIAVGMVSPWQHLTKMVMPAAQVYDIGLGLPILTKIIVFGAFCGLITTLNSFFVAGARVLLALGRAGMVYPAFAQIHSNYQTPVFANCFIGAITLCGAFLGRSMLLPIINVCSFGFMFVWLMVSLAAIKLRTLCPEMPRPYKVKTITLKGAAVLSAAMLALLVIPGSPGALTWPVEILIVVIWFILGSIQRYFWG